MSRATKLPHLSTAEAKRLGLDTKAAVDAFNRFDPPRTKRKRRKAAVGPSMFPQLCREHGLPEPIPEYRFHPYRRWRFDWAFDVHDEKYAIEVQGGNFAGGSHSRGGFLRGEYQKLCEAAIFGWRVLFVLPEQMENGEVFTLLRRAFGIEE